MKPRDWFGVGIRLLGVWMLLSAIDNIRTSSDILLHFFNPQYSLSLYVIRAIVDGALGVYLLTGAPALLSFAYPRGREILCDACGYNLTGNASGVCPECGTPLPKEPAEKSQRPV